mgnify:CR=1 FL=1
MCPRVMSGMFGLSTAQLELLLPVLIVVVLVLAAAWTVVVLYRDSD